MDADTVAGWRRATPSFAQLTAAVADLRRQSPEAKVAIVGDPALKWALSPPDQQLLDEEINHQRIVLAPAGAKEGHVGFIAAAAQKARALGLDPVVVTDRVVPLRDRPAGARGNRFTFDLDGAQVTDADRARPVIRRRRKRARVP